MKKKKAAARTAARKSKPPFEPYRKGESLSSFKTLIAALLLFGDRRRKAFWPLFDAILRQYFDLKLASHGSSDKPQSEKSHRPENGPRNIA